MVNAVIVPGLADIQVDTGTSNTMERLGFTRNGVDVTNEGFFLDVPGDERGGDDGPPIDVIQMGEIARIRIEMTKYDQTIVDKVRARVYGNIVAAGVLSPSPAGTLMFGNSFRLLINSVNDPRNYLIAFPRMPHERNFGTKWATLVMEFEAHENAAGVLENADITGAV